MRAAGVLVLLGACGFSPHAGPADGGAPAEALDAAPHYRKKLTLSVNSPTDLADFPVSIVLADPDLAAHAPDAGSIGFTALDGTPLAREVVAFDPSTGALEAWVRIPHVTATLDIYVVYGAGTPVVATGTWAPELYAAAWHLAEASGPWTDSAAGHTVTPATADTTAASIPNGVVGAARQFDGVDDATPGDDPADGSLDFGTGPFSVEVWVDIAHSADAYDMVIDKGGDTNKPGYCLTLGTGSWYAEVGDNNYITAKFGDEGPLLNHWDQLVAVIDRGGVTSANNLLAYANGKLAETKAFGAIGSVDSVTPLAIGSTQNMYRFEGIVDEIRIARTVLSADWIAAEYRNLTARAAFVTVASEEAL